MLRSGAFEVALEFNCQSVVNPLVDVSQFRPDAGNQYGRFKDDELIKLHDAMSQTGDVAEQKKIMRAFEKRVLNDAGPQLHHAVVVPHHPAPVLHEGVGDHAQPLPEPGPVADLDR